MLKLPTCYALLIIFLSACSLPELIKSSHLTADQLKASGLLSSYWHQTEGSQLHYVRGGLDRGPILVFIHGTPGDWRIFGPLLADNDLAATAQLIAVDRPGWGESLLPDGGVKTSLATQAYLIRPLLENLRNTNPDQAIVLVGHSLGASLVPRIAMDFPALVDTAVVIAGDLSPSYFPARWYNYTLDWLLISWLLPSEMRKANREVMALEQELELMVPMWRDFAVPLVVVQGMDDGLVDPRNADFIEEVIPPKRLSVRRIENSGHLLHLTHTEKVVAILTNTLNKLNKYLK